MIFGSALCALEGKMPEIGEQAVKQLLDTMDEKFIIPNRNTTTEPLFPAEHVYQIKGLAFFI